MSQRDSLRLQVEAAVFEAAGRLGPGGTIDRAAIVNSFAGTVPERTLFRWIKQLVDSGKVAAHVSRGIARAVAQRTARGSGAGATVIADATASLPKVIGVADLTGSSVVELIERIETALSATEHVMRHARTDDGKVRNGKLLLAASNSLVRNLQIANELRRSIEQARKIEEFHVAIMDELQAASPELAERVLLRLRRTCDRFEPPVR